MLEILSEASNAVSWVKRSEERMIHYLSHARSYKPQHRAIKQQFKNNPNTAHSKNEGEKEIAPHLDEKSEIGSNLNHMRRSTADNMYNLLYTNNNFQQYLPLELKKLLDL